MYLSGSHLQLRKTGRRSNPRRIILLLALILGGVLVLGLKERGDVRPVGAPTPAPTRAAPSYAEQAEALFAAGRLDQAVEAYKEATTRDSRNVDYWVALARIQIYNRQYEASLHTAETARLVAPNNVKAKAIYAWAVYWNFGLTGCKCKTQEEALTAAREALALDRNYAPAHAYYSEILNDAGEYTEGASQAQQALTLDPNSLDARRAMGMANEMVGNYAGAAERYKSALAINPNLITLYLRLGRMYQALAQKGEMSYELAIDAFTKANAINPADVEPFLRLSEVYYQDDQLGVAEQYLEQALQREPANPLIHGKLGLLLVRVEFAGELGDDGRIIAACRHAPAAVVQVAAGRAALTVRDAPALPRREVEQRQHSILTVGLLQRLPHHVSRRRPDTRICGFAKMLAADGLC